MSGSPVGEEAGKLFAAFQHWLGANGGSVPIATGSPECCICPLCQLIVLVRTARPEMVEHLTGMATEALTALRAAFDASFEKTAEPEPEKSSRPAGQRHAKRGGVERIDVED
jgi:hypothetical protein